MQGDDAVIGHLVIAGQKGERYASLVKYETAVPPPTEMIPRLWSAEVVSCQFGRIHVRGVQRVQGKMCLQEWECTVFGNQDRAAS